MTIEKEVKPKIEFYIPRVIAVLVFLIFFACLWISSSIIEKSSPACKDGTLEGKCSQRQPYFCENKELIEKAFRCNCTENMRVLGKSCISRYYTEPRNVSLNYILRGEQNQIEFTVYKGIKNYLSKNPKTSSYEKNTSVYELKIKNINLENQKEALLPLITEIQNVATSEEDEVRIAVSIVQEINYNSSNIVINSFGTEVNYSRYAYEVLYDLQGICGEKSELLAFILKELGYGTVIFYFPFENHEAVGIKCPIAYSFRKTGYCFIETTGPSIISDNELEYVEVERLYSEPEILIISEGKSLKNNLYEYKDAETLMKIRKIKNRTGALNGFRARIFEELKKKYDLGEEYNYLL